jgi:hypothetical protein
MDDAIKWFAGMASMASKMSLVSSGSNVITRVSVYWVMSNVGHMQHRQASGSRPPLGEFVRRKGNVKRSARRQIQLRNYEPGSIASRVASKWQTNNLLV